MNPSRFVAASLRSELFLRTARTAVTALAFAAIGLIATGASAQAAVVIHQGTLQQYCYAKYQPRGIQAIAEPIRYSPYGPQLLCKLPGTQFGYTLESHSAAEVCAYLTGSPSSQNQNGQIVCLGSQAVRTSRITPGPQPTSQPHINLKRMGQCYFAAGRFWC